MRGQSKGGRAGRGFFQARQFQWSRQGVACWPEISGFAEAMMSCARKVGFQRETALRRVLVYRVRKFAAKSLDQFIPR
jgi:hypothetical protein